MHPCIATARWDARFPNVGCSIILLAIVRYAANRSYSWGVAIPFERIHGLQAIIQMLSTMLPAGTGSHC